MVELSNRFLATLVIVAMVISVFGFIASLSKIGEFAPIITGAGTTGSVNLTVESLVAINFSFHAEGGLEGAPGNISWGTGSVAVGQSYANLTTRGTATNWNGSSVTGALHLENIGNKGAKLVITSTNTSAATFLGGTNPIYRYNISEDEVGSCGNTSTNPYDHEVAGLNGSFFTSATFNVNASRTICGNFSFQSTKDEILIGFYLGLPSDSGSGDHQDVIGATITAA
ncbi:MAG: hypothetical protein HYS32_03225 [Candidatus Woesearchaeota archaeon]|nr:MAG: hypothetical protein HYS32_03225 [Candidatus Woesearchaeota archaeon]